VSAEVLRGVAPLAMEAISQLIADRAHADVEQPRRCELPLEQSRYEAMHARRQYHAVDLENRLVAANGECLATVGRLEVQIENLCHEQPAMLSEYDRTANQIHTLII